MYYANYHLLLTVIGSKSPHVDRLWHIHYRVQWLWHNTSTSCGGCCWFIFGPMMAYTSSRGPMVAYTSTSCGGCCLFSFSLKMFVRVALPWGKRRALPLNVRGPTVAYTSTSCGGCCLFFLGLEISEHVILSWGKGRVLPLNVCGPTVAFTSSRGPIVA